MPETKTPDQPAGSRHQGNARRESVVTRLVRRSGSDVQELLEALGMREQLSGEAKDLARLMEQKLAYSLPPIDREAALDQLAIQRAYLVHRFIGPLKRFERGDRFYGYLDTVLNFLSILAGVGGSLAAALDSSKVYAISAGLVVGLLQSVSQWLKPARRSTSRGISASSLRTEAWAFLQARDRYKGRDDAAAWTLFCDQVEKVELREQGDEESELASAPPAPASPR